ncbi:helix-turn-helix domain-containing protein [Kribbella qitaiheensis]|uniref:Helix-turn-helix domain-containing protein n=1 Tax=Kribbella qitaiheensis TaxID=1544730 RepID=A0A7G6WVH1_9ACTN|nr:helix-turn-helix domain-containing protein [Kribbella qitaiheensis]QNE17986.1 helix-turn-helix domain-containing protein [Kribbella qitaiheensis]
MGDEELGALLRKHRTSAGLTQAALAEKAGLSEQAVSLLERGTRRRPRIETIHALGAALGLDDKSVEALALAAKSARRTQPALSELPTAPVAEVPRQLPPTLSDFTGREAQLELLLQTLTRADGAPGTVRMVAVTGMGGVGKTALAIHAAHLTADKFPDGHLYLDLRGYGPGDVISPLEALGQLLRSLDVDDRTIPEGVNEAAALYRSRLAELRMLIVLDNANSAGQVTPLLPGAPGSAVIVTSRRALTTLPGFRQVNLAPLPEAESVRLLTRIAAGSQVSPQSAATRSIARLTGHLPLAVRLIGARLAARPSWPVEYVVEQLEDEHRRLDELGTGESGVRANIAGSVEFLANSNDKLDQEAAAALDLLGLPNASELITVTAAHLLGDTVGHAEQMLERLVDLNLLGSIGPGRYRFHDLILAYARERSHQVLSEGLRTDALTRLLQLYTGIAWRCQQLTHPGNHRLELASPLPRSLPELADTRAALAWLDQERFNLDEAFNQASRSPTLRSLIPELGLALFGYYETRDRWSEMRTCDAVARELAGEFGFDRLAAWLEHDLAIPDIEQVDLEPGRVHMLRSLEMFQALGDLAGQARCCTSLSFVHALLNEPDEALRWAQEGLALSQQIGDESLEGISHLALGRGYALRGELDEAQHSWAVSIDLARASGNLRSLGKRHQTAGTIYLTIGEYERAVQPLLTSLEVFERGGDPTSQAETRLHLAAVYRKSGNHPEAVVQAEAGLQLARTYTNRQREGQLLIELGKIQAAQNKLPEAHTLWHQAATLLAAISPNDEADARRLLTDNPVGD